MTLYEKMLYSLFGLKSVNEHRGSQWFKKFRADLDQTYGKWVNEVAHWVVGLANKPD